MLFKLFWYKVFVHWKLKLLNFLILEKNNLQTVQEWTKSYIELIAFYVHPKNSNHLRSHLRATMVLDHSSLDLEKKFLENKSAKSFVFNKFALQNLAKKSGGLLLHITSEVKEYYEVLFLLYFTILKYKLFSFNIHDDQSTHGLLAKPLKKFPKSPIRPAGCELWSVWMNINRVTLQHNKEFIMYMFVYFLFSGFITMCNLQKRLIHTAFWVLLQAMFMNNWKWLHSD